MPFSCIKIEAQCDVRKGRREELLDAWRAPAAMPACTGAGAACSRAEYPRPGGTQAWAAPILHRSDSSGRCSHARWEPPPPPHQHHHHYPIYTKHTLTTIPPPNAHLQNAPHLRDFRREDHRKLGGRLRRLGRLSARSSLQRGHCKVRQGQKEGQAGTLQGQVESRTVRQGWFMGLPGPPHPLFSPTHC